MSRYINLLFVLPVSFLLTGCPLGTNYPLAPSTNAPMDQRLPGTWVVEKSNGEMELESIAILAFNRTEYLIAFRKQRREKDEYARAYITLIDNTSFLNLQFLGEREEEFSFYSYSFSSHNTLFVQAVDEHLFRNPPTSSGELRKLIKKNLNDPLLYGDNVIFRRIR